MLLHDYNTVINIYVSFVCLLFCFFSHSILSLIDDYNIVINIYLSFVCLLFVYVKS